MKRIRLGMVGGGKGSFFGIAHRIATYVSEKDFLLVGGVFNTDHKNSLEFASELELDPDRVYKTVEEMISRERNLPEDERMKAVAIMTPNKMHYDAAKQLIEAGIHVICEKPVTMTAAEAEDLERLVKKYNVVFCLTHTYTGYPMVRQMKKMIEEGEIGDIQRVDAQYYQGWINPIIHDKAKRSSIWRLNPEMAGISSCMGDIGVHAFNMIEYTTGIKVKSVLSDLSTLYDDNPLDVDGSVLLRLEGNIRGVINSSQIATGEENGVRIKVYGSKGGLRWYQENPNYLYRLHADRPMEVYKPGNAYNHKFALESHTMAPGHPEGIYEAMGNLYKGAAKAIRKEPLENGQFPGIYEGVRGMKFIEGVVKSTKEGNIWVDIR